MTQITDVLAMLALCGELGGKQPHEAPADYLRRLIDALIRNEAKLGSALEILTEARDIIAHEMPVRGNDFVAQCDALLSAPPREASQATGVGEALCTFGQPAERKPQWILKFEDADVGDMHFDDEVEAIENFKRFTVTYNCTLFVTAALAARPAVSEEENCCRHP